MDRRDTHRLKRYVRRIEELRLWRNAREYPLRDWYFSAEDGEPRALRLGDFWPEAAPPVRLSAEAKIPEGWSGLPVELELWLGGEGFVRISNGVSGGLDPFHRSYPLTEAAQGGEVVAVEAEVVSKGLFGSRIVEPRLKHAALVIPEPEIRALERDLSMIAEACHELDDHDAVPLLLDVLDAAFGALASDWPTGTDVALTRYLQGYANPLGGDFLSLPRFAAEKALDVNRLGRELWNVPEAPRPLEPLPGRARLAVRKARKIVAARLNEIKEDYPPVGRLALTGHAHLDLAWLWPLSETRRKARRTFASVLGLMNRYGDFVFNQSSAQLYAWVEEDDPGLFECVRERVREGRWEPVGGSWTEPDCQLPGGESFIRQLLYGIRYFEEKFGCRSTVAWLPDVFGFSANLPQLLRGAGLTGFFTAKLSWNETNDFPHDLFIWEGIDGSRVVAYTLDNPGMDYNGDIAPFDILGAWRNFRGKRRHPEGLLPFGWGDGGGGPSEKMLENYARLKEFPGLPRLRMTSVDGFFASLPEEGLPLWAGELYLELHRGTLTTQGRVKKLNREAEHRLLEAEAFATLASLHGAPYPREDLERVWKTLLLNQFHDILPGSSISEVYEDAHRQLEETVESAEKLRDGALGRLTSSVESGSGEAVIVANAALTPRPLSFLVPWDGIADVTDAEGDPLPVQDTKEGLLVHAPDREVPGLGWTTLLLSRRDRRPPAPQVATGVTSGRSGDGVFLENALLRVEVGADGSLHRVFDKESGREVLSGRGNQLWAYVDKPREWDAWDIDEDYELEGEEISAVTDLRRVEAGPLRVTVNVARRWRDSSIEQAYKLYSVSRRLEIETWVEWRERQVLLRALFPLNAHSHEAVFETMYGTYRRPTRRNTSWDATRFEVSAHRFCDLSETGYGAALLNDGKYGHSARENVLGVSLLRSPLYPDPRADEGYHHFTYSLFPHPGCWTEAGVAEEAFALNSPLFAATGGETLPPEFGLVVVEGVRLALGSLKGAEDGRGVILRLYEPHGARGRCVLRFACPVERAERVNLLEEPEGTVEVRGEEILLAVRPFEVVTLYMELGMGYKMPGQSWEGI